jgi:hypothetical protein
VRYLLALPLQRGVASLVFWCHFLVTGNRLKCVFPSSCKSPWRVTFSLNYLESPKQIPFLLLTCNSQEKLSYSIIFVSISTIRLPGIFF